jgi:hypothetical protein
MMTAPSAYSDTYSENKVLYRKTVFNAVEIFEYSNDAQQLCPLYWLAQYWKLYNTNSATISRVYEYIPPVNGIPQGNYEPNSAYCANKVQVATFLGKYKPTEKLSILSLALLIKIYFPSM